MAVGQGGFLATARGFGASRVPSIPFLRAEIQVGFRPNATWAGPSSLYVSVLYRLPLALCFASAVDGVGNYGGKTNGW